MENPHPSSSPKFFLLTFSSEPCLAKFTIFVHHQMLHKIIHPTFSFHRHPRTPNPDQDQRLLAGWWWQWSWLRAAFWGWGVFFKKHQVLEVFFQKHQVFGSSLGWGEMFGRHIYSLFLIYLLLRYTIQQKVWCGVCCWVWQLLTSISCRIPGTFEQSGIWRGWNRPKKTSLPQNLAISKNIIAILISIRYIWIHFQKAMASKSFLGK